MYVWGLVWLLRGASWLRSQGFDAGEWHYHRALGATPKKGPLMPLPVTTHIYGAIITTLGLASRYKKNPYQQAGSP